MEHFEITVTPKNSHIVITLKGRLDLLAAQTIEKQLDQTADGKAPVIIIDISELIYVSSAGLRVLLLTAKTAQRNHGRVSLSGMRKQVEETFKISGFLSIFELYPSLADAEAILPG